MDFGQLAKVGNVFEHYAKHRAEEAVVENGTVSFLDFVWTHFIKPAAHDGQHPGSDHQELPFHSISTSPVFAVYYCCLPVEAHPVALPNDVAFHYAGLLLNDVLDSFFHPPAHLG
jgi:hypothetical protein